MQIFVKTLTGKTITLEVERIGHYRECEDEDPRQRRDPSGSAKTDLCGEAIRGWEDTLADYNIQKESTIHLVLRLR